MHKLITETHCTGTQNMLIICIVMLKVLQTVLQVQGSGYEFVLMVLFSHRNVVSQAVRSFNKLPMMSLQAKCLIDTLQVLDKASVCVACRNKAQAHLL